MNLNFLKSKKASHCFAFYNIENLFDITDDKYTNDKDFLENSKLRWDLKRYKTKLRKIGFAISQIGLEETNNSPAIIGLAEVENEIVIKDLLNSEHLKELPYEFVHYNSQDERGIDVAFIYNTNLFKVTDSEIFSIILEEDDGEIDYTRDILVVKGLYEGEPITFLVNHWPSRRTGSVNTEGKRLVAAQKVQDIINALKSQDPELRVIVMGDFNDDPSSKSIKQVVESCELFNPMETLISLYRGTTVHRDEWNLFDQMFFSTNFFERKRNALRYFKSEIFDPEFLKVNNGPYKGYPYRTYVGKKYMGGFSDHFPVYTIFKK